MVHARLKYIYLFIYFCRHNIKVEGYIKSEFLREFTYSDGIFAYFFLCSLLWWDRSENKLFSQPTTFPSGETVGRGGSKDEQGLLSAGNWITLVDPKGCRAALNVNCENKKVRQTRRGPLFIFLAAFSFYTV